MSHAFCSEEIKAQMEMKETFLKLNVHVFRDTEVQSEYETGRDGPSLLCPVSRRLWSKVMKWCCEQT